MHSTAAENLLQAFPPAFPEETSKERKLRQEAYNTCWTAINEQFDVVGYLFANQPCRHTACSAADRQMYDAGSA